MGRFDGLTFEGRPLEEFFEGKKQEEIVDHLSNNLADMRRIIRKGLRVRFKDFLKKHGRVRRFSREEIKQIEREMMLMSPNEEKPIFPEDPRYSASRILKALHLLSFPSGEWISTGQLAEKLGILSSSTSSILSRADKLLEDLIEVNRDSSPFLRRIKLGCKFETPEAIAEEFGRRLESKKKYKKFEGPVRKVVRGKIEELEVKPEMKPAIHPTELIAGLPTRVEVTVTGRVEVVFRFIAGRN